MSGSVFKSVIQLLILAGRYLHDGEGYRDRAFRLQCGVGAGYRFEAMAPGVDPALIGEVMAIALQLADRCAKPVTRSRAGATPA